MNRHRQIRRAPRPLALLNRPVLAALLLAALPAYSNPRDVCRGFKTEEQRKICYEKKYQEADYELNRVYRLLQEKMPEDQRAEMKSSSRDWIRNKEYICGYQAEMETGKTDPKNSTYFSCLLDFTRSRTLYLRQAFGGEGVSPGKAGMYEDGAGGRLELKKKTDDRFEFSIEVVRGPTAHIGEIHGAFTLSGRKGLFQSKEFCEAEGSKDSGSCCRLSFEFQKYHLKVTEKDCSYYRGARAYFDGEYRKVR